MDGLKSGSDDTVGRGTVIAGRYVVDEPIARTALSVVYRVEHVHTGERLAMKILGGRARMDPEALQRFKREVRTSSRLRSDHVVLVTDADTAPELDGAPFMVMELLRGVDLETHATREGPLAPEAVVAILAPVAAVLEQAHGLGIVHRDLKPENLFLHERPDGTTIAKVLDFGISKFVSGDVASSAVSVTSTGVVLGTPLYMSPEQAHGKNDEVGPTTDVWAMGLVAMRLLTGEHYWGRPTMAELMTKITVAPLVPPSERWPSSKHMSPALDAWFLRSCDREREKRWPSVGEQMRALAAALVLPLPKSVARNEEAALATRASAREVETLREEHALQVGEASPRRARTLAAAIGLVVVAGVPWLLLRDRHEADRTGIEGTTSSHPSAPSPSPTVATSTGEAASAASVEARPALLDGGTATTGTAAGLAKTSEASRPRSAAAGSRAITPSARVESVASCGEAEVLSFGHCCPSGHVWQSGRCARPVATSF